MNLFESIKKNLNEANTNNFNSLPDIVKDEVITDGHSDIYYCNDCKMYFEYPNEKEVDMENYYGVGSQFSDHHYQTMGFCPHCDSENYEELHFDLEDVINDYIEDYSNEETIINKFNEVHPELVNPDINIFEDYPDEVYNMVKDYELYIEGGN